MEDTVILQVGVKAFLKGPDGTFLFVRKNPEKYPEAGAIWDLPGGRIHPGSPLLDNLKREIMKETGLTLTDTPKLIAAQDILRVLGRHVVRLTYTANIEGEPVIDEESLEHKWFTRKELELEKDLDPYFKEVLSEQQLL